MYTFAYSAQVRARPTPSRRRSARASVTAACPGPRGARRRACEARSACGVREDTHRSRRAVNHQVDRRQTVLQALLPAQVPPIDVRPVGEHAHLEGSVVVLAGNLQRPCERRRSGLVVGVVGSAVPTVTGQQPTGSERVSRNMRGAPESPSRALPAASPAPPSAARRGRDGPIVIACREVPVERARDVTDCLRADRRTSAPALPAPDPDRGAPRQWTRQPERPPSRRSPG